jgi:hypothetical protein
VVAEGLLLQVQLQVQDKMVAVAAVLQTAKDPVLMVHQILAAVLEELVQVAVQQAVQVVQVLFTSVCQLQIIQEHNLVEQ